MLRVVPLCCVVLFAAGMINPAYSQQSPPNPDEAKRIETLVNKAAALVERQGKGAFSEFRQRDSEWWFGNTYLFAYDTNLNVFVKSGLSTNERVQIPAERRTRRASHFTTNF